MIYRHNIDPAILRIGNIEIRWYGIIYILGFVLSYLFFSYCKKNKLLRISNDDLLDLFFYSFFGLTIGARIFYVLFYNLAYYFENPLKIFFVWEGGFSFHGGLLGVILGGLIFCKQYKKNFFKLADLMTIPVSLALGIGRIGNFINGELWGRPTGANWGVIFPNAFGEDPRHPSQIYEFFKNELIFLVLILVFLKYKKRKDGFLLALFLVLYGVLRFLVEFFREPEVYVGALTMGQFLSLPLIIAGTLMLIFIFRKKIYAHKKNNSVPRH